MKYRIRKLLNSGEYKIMMSYLFSLYLSLSLFLSLSSESSQYDLQNGNVRTYTSYDCCYQHNFRLSLMSSNFLLLFFSLFFLVLLASLSQTLSISFFSFFFHFLLVLLSAHKIFHSQDIPSSSSLNDAIFNFLVITHFRPTHFLSSFTSLFLSLGNFLLSSATKGLNLLKSEFRYAI